MYIQVDQVPLRTATLRKFSGTNPWGDSASADYEIMLYSVFAGGYASPDAPGVQKAIARNEKIGLPPTRLLRGDELLALHCNGQRHMMPRALARLWVAGRIKDEQLPRVLHSLEPHLRRTDLPTRDTGRIIAFFALFFLLAAGGAFIAIRSANAYWRDQMFFIPPLLVVIAFAFFGFAGYLRGRDAMLTRLAVQKIAS